MGRSVDSLMKLGRVQHESAGGPACCISRIQTTLVVVLTSHLRLLDAPGNVLLSAKLTGLPKDSVANVSQLVTLDRDYLRDRIGKVPPRVMAAIHAGLKLVLGLP